MAKADIIQSFYKEVFNEHNAQAAEKYIVKNYIQHNPGLGQGRKCFIEAFAEKFRQVPSFRLDIVRIIEQGDMVAVHLHAIGEPGISEAAVVDFYRFEGEMIAEHWDVLMPIPSKLIGNNNIF
ncbi:MAG: ester cyclase [Angelakisella sp.]